VTVGAWGEQSGADDAWIVGRKEGRKKKMADRIAKVTREPSTVGNESGLGHAMRTASLRKERDCSHIDVDQRLLEQPLSPLCRAAAGKGSQRLNVQEEELVGKQMTMAELQALINLLEARGRGVLKLVADKDKFHTNINLRALVSALAIRRTELDIIGQKVQWPLSIREGVSERLREIVSVPMERRSNLLVNQVSSPWKDKWIA
jgi:hypothetical protein